MNLTTDQKAEAKALLDQMIAMDLSRMSMDLRLDEVEAQARRLDDRERKAHILALAGEIRHLITRDRKLATAGLLAGRHLLPYSQL